MTTEGVQQLYLYLSAAWPLTVRPGADEEWKRAKMRELFQTYRNYGDEEVTDAYMKWTESNDVFPKVKNIINEIEWAHALKAKAETGSGTYQMELIRDDGTELVLMVDGKIEFTQTEFVNLPNNKDHLTPDEWDRRHRARRRQILRKLAERRPR